MKKVILMAAAVMAGFALKADMLLWQVDGHTGDASSSTSQYVQLWTSSVEGATFWSSSFNQNGNAKEITPGSSTVEFTVTGPYESYFVEYLTYDSTKEKWTSQGGYGGSWDDLANAKALSSSLASAAATMTAYTGGSYTSVPEPTSGLMLMLGLALMGLKRKRA